MRLISILLVCLLVNCISAQDTMFIRIDTTLCSIDQSQVFFHTPYDTSIYQTLWRVNDSLDEFIQDSIEVVDNDSLLLLTSFQDTTISDSIFIDTILIDLRIRPSVDLSIPQPACFDGSSIEVIDMTDYFNYPDAQSYFDESGAQISDLIFDVENGDTTTFRLVFNDDSCPDNSIDSLFELSTLLQPTALFAYDKTCENEYLAIENLSSEVMQSTSYRFYESENLIGNFTHSESFTLQDTLSNGSVIMFSIVDNGNGCLDTVESIANIDSVTYVSFTNLESEYCAIQDVSFLEASVIGGQFNGVGVTDLNNGSAVYRPNIAGTDIPISYTYTNGLQCTHTDLQFVNNVFDRPTIILNNLRPEYCEFDPDVLLSINQTIDNNSRYEILKDGFPYDDVIGIDYSFMLDLPGFYTFTNYYEDINGCRDTVISNSIVNPLPILDLDSTRVLVPGEAIEIGTTDNPDIQYQWSNGSMESIILVNQPGIYSLSAINLTTLCENQDTTKLRYDETIETPLFELSIAPNPTTSLITVNTFKSLNGIRLLDIFGALVSINGQTVFNTDENGELVLDLNNQASGYYYVLLPDVGNFLVVKL